MTSGVPGKKPIDIAPAQELTAKLKAALEGYFGPLDDAAFNDFEQRFEWISLPDQAILVKQGEQGDSMFILMEGRLRVVYTDLAGKQKVVGEIDPGTSVGEMALFTGEKRSATIYANGACRLVKLSQQVFDELIVTYPQAIKNIALLVIQRLRGLINAQLEIKMLESQLLLKEMHHRVKNNLQVISSILNLELAQIENPSVREAVQISQDRVKSMALIHQKLYQHNNQEAINAEDYLGTLAGNLVKSYGARPEHIRLDLELSPLLLDVDTAVPLGLIANELITNALKYAFPDPQSRGGCIKVTLFLDEEQQLVLQVIDNGVGMDAPHPTGMGTSFGGKLVNLLRLQLNGTQEIAPPPGTAITLRCKKYELVES